MKDLFTVEMDEQSGEPIAIVTATVVKANEKTLKNSNETPYRWVKAKMKLTEDGEEQVVDAIIYVGADATNTVEVGETIDLSIQLSGEYAGNCKVHLGRGKKANLAGIASLAQFVTEEATEQVEAQA